MLLPHMERQDIWDQLVDSNVDPSVDPNVMLEVRPVDGLVCPSDTELTSNVELAALSYVANTGGWDRDNSGNFLYVGKNTIVGDTLENGVFSNAAEYQLGDRKPLVCAIGKDPRRGGHHADVVGEQR